MVGIHEYRPTWYKIECEWECSTPGTVTKYPCSELVPRNFLAQNTPQISLGHSVCYRFAIHNCSLLWWWWILYQKCGCVVSGVFGPPSPSIPVVLTSLEPQFRFWGQTSQISSSLSPKRDCGSKGVKAILEESFGVLYSCIKSTLVV